MSVAVLEQGPTHVIGPPRDGRYTGQVLLTTRPKTYRKVVELLAQPMVSIDTITRTCKVSQHTVEAIRAREASSIATRKMELSRMVSDIAHIGAARVADTIGKAKVRDAIIGTGVAIDKFLALEGQTPAVQIANVIMPSEADREERRQLHDKLDEIARRLGTTSS
jgi:hypothetical protein